MNTATKNKMVYLKPPPIIQILEFVSEQGVSIYQFERFYGIPRGTIKQIKFGNCELPAKYWHIIYEKIKPTYGAGYYKKEVRKKAVAPKKTVATPPKAEDSSLLSELKNKLG